MRKRRHLEENGSYLKAEKKHLRSFPLYNKKRGKFIVLEFLGRQKLPQIQTTFLTLFKCANILQNTNWWPLI